MKGIWKKYIIACRILNLKKKIVISESMPTNHCFGDYDEVFKPNL